MILINIYFKAQINCSFTVISNVEGSHLLGLIPRLHILLPKYVFTISHYSRIIYFSFYKVLALLFSSTGLII